MLSPHFPKLGHWSELVAIDDWILQLLDMDVIIQSRNDLLEVINVSITGFMLSLLMLPVLQLLDV